MVNNQRYRMSFTTGSLFKRESVKLADLYLELNEWNTVRDNVLSQNLLQARTQNTAKRVWREISFRLKTLDNLELDLLVHGKTQEQDYLLWLAICRRYQFIADFAVEVIRERFLSLKMDLQYEDFDFFFNKKLERHPELDVITPITRNKLRQVLFKILREAGLLTADNTINPALLSPSLLSVISRGSRHDILFFPVYESELQERV